MLTHAASNMAPFGEVAGGLPVIFYVACAALIVLYAGWKTLTKMESQILRDDAQKRRYSPQTDRLVHS